MTRVTAMLATHPSVQIDLRADEPVDRTIAYETASAEFHLPEGVEWPFAGRVFVRALRPEDGAQLFAEQGAIADGEIADGGGKRFRRVGDVLHLDMLLAGDVILEVGVFRRTEEPGHEIVPTLGRPVAAARTRIHLEHGATNSIHLEPGDG